MSAQCFSINSGKLGFASAEPVRKGSSQLENGGRERIVRQTRARVVKESKYGSRTSGDDDAGGGTDDEGLTA